MSSTIALDRPRRGGRSPFFPKGRQVEDKATNEICQLLGTQPRRRDLLIEYLHLIQDTYKQLSAAHLAALASEMGPGTEKWPWPVKWALANTIAKPCPEKSVCNISNDVSLVKSYR